MRGSTKRARAASPRRFVWALPQVARDGFIRLASDPEEDDMQAFDDVLFPLALGPRCRR